MKDALGIFAAGLVVAVWVVLPFLGVLWLFGVI